MEKEKNSVISPGTLVYSPVAGKGQVIAIEVSLPNCQTKTVKFPYLNDIPDEIKLIQMEEKCIMIVLVKE